jgi:AraC-like DNA-binding protein
MNQFVFQQGNSGELHLFPHIIELGIIKNSSIRLNAFPISSTTGIKLMYVAEGKFHWTINQDQFMLYPGDVLLILPGQEFGSSAGVLEIGSYLWINIEVEQRGMGEILMGPWSGFNEPENLAIGKILLFNSFPVISRFNVAGNILKCIQQELFSQELGYCARVNNQIGDLFILIARQISNHTNPGRDFPNAFMKLEQELRKDLSRQWTVDEMAGLVGLGTTLFNDKVKSFSGFSPINYLINIRISEAIKLLKQAGISLTDIALDTGFYSSQHFSTTFKKLTGYTPSEFRKNHLPEK